MEYYSALTNLNNVHATTWTNLGDFMLSEIKKTQTNTYDCTYVRDLEQQNSQKVEWCCQRLGERAGKLQHQGIVSVLQDEKNSGDWLYNIVNVLTLLDCTFKNGYDDIFHIICILPQLKNTGKVTFWRL